MPPTIQRQLPRAAEPVHHHAGHLPPRRSPATVPAPPASTVTSLVLEAILGLAVCLGVVGLIDHAHPRSGASGTPDAPPPAVLVQVDR